MLGMILLCVIGCLFFIFAAIRFKKQLDKQEEDMANLRATRRQEARDRELAMEEFLDLQERCRLDLIHQHFEFFTIRSSSAAGVSAEGNITKQGNQIEDVNRKISDMDKTNLTLTTSFDDTDLDEEDLQQKGSSSETSTTSDADHRESSSSAANATSPIPSSSTNNKSETSTKIPSDSNDTNQNNVGILSSWLSTIYRPQQQNMKSCEGTDDDIEMQEGECCCICLEAYQPNDVVCRAKSSSACHHMFHKKCALQWFLRNSQNNQCPMCRINLLPNADDDNLICVRASNP